MIDNTTWEGNIRKEVEALLALVNVDELIQVAISLRDGKIARSNQDDT
jgi:hypothetical protein